MPAPERQFGRAGAAYDAPGYKVLVVEDEGLIALDIAGRLESMGHSVVGTASTAEEALAQAGAADIVLMDIRIDGEHDGIQAATEIRERYRLPVVFLTAHADRATLERAKQAGAFGYIVKPMGPSSLQAGIEMAVAKHHTERLLDEREAWLRAVVGSVADAAVVTTPEGLVHLMNPAAERLTGWTQAEAEGQPVQAVIRLSHVTNQRAEDEEFDPTPLAILRDAPVDFGPGCLLMARDGRQLEVEGSVAPVQSSRGHSAQPGSQAARETFGAVLTLRDASVRRWEERQLRQAQRAQAAGRLAAGAANEYQNLIGLIRGHAEHLLQQLSDYAAVRPALEEIQQAAAAADRLTRSLAGLGARQMGHPQAVSLNAILRRMARLIEATAGGRILVSIRPSPHCGQVWADPSQLETAILKLVIHASNTMASNTMPEGGRLLIETSRLELPGVLFNAGRMVEHVLLGLTYSGVEPDIERLFDPESPSDSGLALALVYSLVAECGGYLSAAAGPHGGSRIEMLLPRVSEQVLLPGPNRMPGRAATVLFVDHRDLIRTELHNLFEAAGYNFLEAGDPAEAVALGEIREGGIDAVVADSADAAKILNGLRSSCPALRVLRIVDHGESGVGVLRRPFTTQMLLSSVAALLEPEPAGAAASQVSM